MNPYAQGGWRNPQNPHSITGERWGTGPNQPPTFGALPYSISASSPTILKFFITSPNHDILNCSVVGSDSKKCFDIFTNPSAYPCQTTFTWPDGRSFAIIEWQKHPLVQIVNIIPRQPTSRWFSVAEPNSSRTMSVGSSRYLWTSWNGKSYVYDSNNEPLAKISAEKEIFSLEITTGAVKAGLLEPFVVAMALLFSGRHIE